MYQPSESVDLCMNQQLLHRYESEEEDVSESELGQNAFSPVVSQRAAEPFDSDLSADERSNMDEYDRDHVPLRLPPYSGPKDSRPVSMDTIKRSSAATFVGETFFLGHDDDMVWELPSPDTSSAHRSSMFLQPTVYVPEQLKPLPERPPSPSASILSEEQPDLLVAEKVTYMEPDTRPNLIIISPFARSFSETQLNIKRAHRNSSVVGGNVEIPWSTSKDGQFDQRKLRPVSTQVGPTDVELSPKSTEPDVTALPSISYRPRPMSFSRPRTPQPEKSSLSVRSRLVPELPLRPPSMRSMRSMSSASLSYTPSAPTSPMPSEASYQSYHRPQKSGSFSSLSRTASALPNYSSPKFYRDRTGSSYSSSSTGHRSPSLLRNETVKHSVTSSISTASMRSDADSVYNLDQSAEDGKGLKKKASRRGLRLRPKFDKDEPVPSSPLKGLMGLTLGRKKTMTK